MLRSAVLNCHVPRSSLGLFAMLLALGVACGNDSGTASGAAGGACYDDGTCDGTLECIGEICVDLTGTTLCPTGQAECGGQCVDLDRDSQHCGACDVVCSPGEICNGSGSCELSCQDGLTECGGQCVDVDRDSQHCGACDVVCSPGEICNGSGSCELTCQDGLTECGGQCVDVDRDNQHCGACDVACSPGEICNGSGSCELSCQDGLTECSGQCVDLDRDSQHCGACDLVCSPGEICNGSGSCELSCPDGLIECSGTCVDPTSDADHCGACGVTCDNRCTPFGCGSYVFVTDAVQNGNLGGLAGADATCLAEAQAAGLKGSFRAWLSGATISAAERLVPSSEPYFRTDGTAIAGNWSELVDGSLDAPISLNAAGQAPNTDPCNTDSVWTNTTTAGAIVNTSWTCSEWTTGSGVGHIGEADRSDALWTSNSGAACNFQSVCGVGTSVGARLYCFQQ